MTIRSWLQRATTQLKQQKISSAALDAELILTHTLQTDRTTILGHPERSLTDQEASDADRLLARRRHLEPMAYVVGEKDFYGLAFQADRRALIPRGETETLVETALAWLDSRPTGQTVVEIGTGSGAIILALANRAPSHRYAATDISHDALDLAQKNADRLKLNSVDWRQGDLAVSLSEDFTDRVDLLAANLPYIPTHWVTQLDPSIRFFEPDLALDGGSDGLDLYRRLIPQSRTLMTKGSLILLEHDHAQATAMRDLARQTYPNANITTIDDSLGEHRILAIENRPSKL